MRFYMEFQRDNLRVKELKRNREECIGNNPIIDFFKNKQIMAISHLLYEIIFVTIIDSTKPMGVFNMEHHILFLILF